MSALRNFTVVQGGGEPLRINGVISSADVWLNGQQVAEEAAVAGAYPVHELDVTRWVHEGLNTLALRVRPADPRTSLSIGWVDWNPAPPDNNMGPWRGVDIVRTGPVEIRFPQVTSTLSLPDLARAASLIATGNRARAVPELQALVLEHPDREQPVCLLAQALHATGRQADAPARA